MHALKSCPSFNIAEAGGIGWLEGNNKAYGGIDLENKAIATSINEPRPVSESEDDVNGSNSRRKQLYISNIPTELVSPKKFIFIGIIIYVVHQLVLDTININEYYYYSYS